MDSLPINNTSRPSPLTPLPQGARGTREESAVRAARRRVAAAVAAIAGALAGRGGRHARVHPRRVGRARAVRPAGSAGRSAARESHVVHGLRHLELDLVSPVGCVLAVLDDLDPRGARAGDHHVADEPASQVAREDHAPPAMAVPFRPAWVTAWRAVVLVDSWVSRDLEWRGDGGGTRRAGPMDSGGTLGTGGGAR